MEDVLFRGLNVRMSLATGVCEEVTTNTTSKRVEYSGQVSRPTGLPRACTSQACHGAAGLTCLVAPEHPSAELSLGAQVASLAKALADAPHGGWCSLSHWQLGQSGLAHAYCMITITHQWHMHGITQQADAETVESLCHSAAE